VSATPSATPSPTPTTKIRIISITPYPGVERGIAQPIVVKFSRSIPRDHRAVVEQALSVQETKATGMGAWRWWAADEVHFRPATFWPAHSVLTLDTTAYTGLDLGYGYVGEGEAPIHWPIGRSFVTYVDAKSDYAHVYQDGKLVRTMAVSLGKPGWESRSGVKVVQERYKIKVMTGASIMAETNYNLKVPYAVRITASGEFIHGAPWALGRLGRWNGSHGCTNLNVPNAEWFYFNSMPGDPVVTSNTGKPMKIWNTFGDWVPSFSQWLQDSAAGEVQVGPAGPSVGMKVPAWNLGILPPQPSPTPPPDYSTQTPTPTPTHKPTPTPTHKPTPTPTHKPTPTPTPTKTPSPTPKPTPTSTPTPTATP
jgi:lipoprotein-anchoring transpeptidase ErfK/SrfK